MAGSGKRSFGHYPTSGTRFLAPLLSNLKSCGLPLYSHCRRSPSPSFSHFALWAFPGHCTVGRWAAGGCVERCGERRVGRRRWRGRHCGEEEEGRRRRREREEAERGDLRRWEGVDPDCGRHDTTGQRSRNSLFALSLTIGIFEKDLTAAESLLCESRPQRKRIK